VRRARRPQRPPLRTRLSPCVPQAAATARTLLKNVDDLKVTADKTNISTGGLAGIISASPLLAYHAWL